MSCPITQRNDRDKDSKVGELDPENSLLFVRPSPPIKRSTEWNVFSLKCLLFSFIQPGILVAVQIVPHPRYAETILGKTEDSPVFHVSRLFVQAMKYSCLPTSGLRLG